MAYTGSSGETQGESFFQKPGFYFFYFHIIKRLKRAFAVRTDVATLEICGIHLIDSAKINKTSANKAELIQT